MSEDDVDEGVWATDRWVDISQPHIMASVFLLALEEDHHVACPSLITHLCAGGRTHKCSA